MLILGLSELYGLQQAAGCERDAKLKTSKVVVSHASIIIFKKNINQSREIENAGERGNKQKNSTRENNFGFVPWSPII